MASIFTSGISFNFLGYDLLHQPAVGIIAEPTDTIDEVVKKNPNIKSIADPRGLFSSGMVPSRELSYRVYHEVLQSFTTRALDLSGVLGLGAIGGGAAAGFFLAFSTDDVVFATTKTRTAVISFQGRDIIDLPVEGLPREGNIITLPHQVYRVYHAGDEKFIKSGDNLSQKFAVAAGLDTADNMFHRVVLTDGATEDVRQLVPTRIRSLLDTASNKIEVDGDPKFVTYTAIDEPLFRDVVLMTVSTEIFGTNTSIAGFIPTSVAPTRSFFSVLRFAFTNIGQDNEKNEVFNWRLSESFGVDPAGEVTPTPADLHSSLSDENKNADVVADSSEHFVYDLNEAGPSVSDTFDLTPLLHGVSPALAKAKSDRNSPFFDGNFKSQAFDIVPGFASTGGVTTIHTVGSTQEGSTVTPAFSYTSPILELNITGAGRLGLEYAVTETVGSTALSLIQDTLVLAKTSESIPGLAVVYDCCINIASVIDVFQGPDSNSMVERVFDDILWAKSQQQTPQSESGKFMLGEFPARSEGKIILIPRQQEIKLQENEPLSGKTTVPSDFVPTAILVTGSETSNPTFSLHSSSDGTGAPVFELAFPGNFEITERQKIFIGLPPLDEVRSFRQGNGVTLDKLFGNEKNEAFLPGLSGSAGSKDPSEYQISFMEAEGFPMSGTNQSADGSCSQGWSYLGFENNNRVDFAVRRFYSQNWTPIRDVTLRIQDGFESDNFDASAGSLPPSSMPFVLSDPETDIVFLFYVYKQLVLAKKIPGELLMSEKMSEGASTFAASSEEKIIKKLHKLGASVVYDGSGEKASDMIATDIQFGAIRIEKPADTTAGEDEATQEPTLESRPVTQYSLCLDAAGYLYTFIQAEDLMVVRRSSNLGDTWVDILPRDFKFIPLKQGEQLSERPKEEAPSCMFDPETENITVFFFSEKRLFFVKIPSEILRQPAEDVNQRISEFAPTMLLGEATEDLLERGVRAAGTVTKSGEDPLEISPHRVAGYVTNDGYYRVFFKDDEQRLQSLISFDTGDTWLTEQQFLAKDMPVTTGAGSTIASSIQTQ